MDIRAKIQQLKELQQVARVGLPAYARDVAAMDLVALVSNRVTQTGRAHDGTPFSPYSRNRVPAYKFLRKSRSVAAERRISALASQRKTLSYKEFREVNRLKTDKKIFEFTGEMWRKTGIVRASVGAAKAHVTIGGTTKAAQDKIDANSRREKKNILEPTPTEVLQVQTAAADWLNAQAAKMIAP